MNRIRLAFLMAAVITATAAPVLADIPDGDIYLASNGSRLGTGRISEDGSTIYTGVRAFYAEFGADAPNFAEEPGFQSSNGAFTPGSHITFVVNRSLRKWTGADFSTIAPETISMGFGSLPPVVTPLMDTPVVGFPLVVGPLGGLHDHLEYTLGGAASDGVYLLDLSFRSDQGGLGNSDRVWVLYRQNADGATAQAAYDFASVNVPSPGVPGVVVYLGTWMLRRRYCGPRRP